MRAATSTALFAAALAALAPAAAAVADAARPETLMGALARAYRANPTLNAGRAGLRAIDEGVPRALSGYRPSLVGTLSAGATQTAGRTGAPPAAGPFNDRLLPREIGLQATQTLFDGLRTRNAVRQAESEVLAGRASLRQTEQETLEEAAQAYMDVLRDSAILDLQRGNVEVLEEQLRQTRERRVAGQITATDVAQAESRLAGSRSQASLAEANLQGAVAAYRRVIGVAPRRLAAGRPPDRLVPRSLGEAIRAALADHPAITAAFHAVDASELQAKVVAGELAPTLGIVGSVGRAYDSEEPGDRATRAAIVGQVTIPIYGGGEVSARLRQAKETAGQRRIEAEAVRDAVRAAVVAAWSSLEAAKAGIRAAEAQVLANEVALVGVREEARAGRRTTLDVLNQQQELLVARVALVTAQRDRVVGTFALARATGRLTADGLGLDVRATRRAAISTRSATCLGD